MVLAIWAKFGSKRANISEGAWETPIFLLSPRLYLPIGIWNCPYFGWDPLFYFWLGSISPRETCAVQGPRYEVNLRVFAIAYHRLKMQLRSWSLLSKKIKTGGFQNCKVHCCNFKDFKVTSLQSLVTPWFEPRPPAWVAYHREIDSRGRPGLKSLPSRTLKTFNFEVLEVTAMYLTFLETSSLYLFGQERSGA